ncbi:MAG: hypothetical protein AAGE52_42930, partial [Myxococcota bacterium]
GRGLAASSLLAASFLRIARSISWHLAAAVAALSIPLAGAAQTAPTELTETAETETAETETAETETAETETAAPIPSESTTAPGTLLGDPAPPPNAQINPSGILQDALREEDLEGFLSAAPNSRTPTVVCIEAFLEDRRLRLVYFPPAPGPDESTELIAAAAQNAQTFLESALPAYQRCLRRVGDGPFAELGAAVEARVAELDNARALIEDGAYEEARASIHDEAFASLHLSWDELREGYGAAHGAVRDEPERPSLGGRITATMTSGLILVASLIVISTSLRASSGTGSVNARLQLTMGGLAIGAIGGMLIGGAWTEPKGSNASTLLITGGLYTSLLLGTGIALLASDVRRRHQFFGAGMVASAGINVLWLAGGIALRRRAEGRNQGHPTVSVSRHGGGLGWRGSF